MTLNVTFRNFIQLRKELYDHFVQKYGGCIEHKNFFWNLHLCIPNLENETANSIINELKSKYSHPKYDMEISIS